MSIAATAAKRRSLLLGAAGSLLFSGRVWAQAAPSGPHVLPPLPYPPNANEAAIDTLTMEIHHQRHHGAQVAGLNAALQGQPEFAAMALDDLLMNLSRVPQNIRTAVRNNGGGHANHSMFWEIMGGRGGPPTGPVAEAIARDLGGFDKFRQDFNAAGMSVFGSGWVFVTVTNSGQLAITTRPGQDSPLMDGLRVLMGNDVWEHAYYLRYQNRRADYLQAWWNVVNWDKINERYAAALSGTLRV
ncbi:MAG: superoxide dismutase [Rhodovarius sp.]|nr:superoxide dismutase [Rhodovarius sp.]MCX7931635.1 superoxide dismutase [Rhodovarius sp.]MDW8314360.1 superoxide dismutase [Rhodovarius sp.]